MNKDNNDNNIMSSPHVGGQLSEYIDKSLPVGELDAVRVHLEGCDACRADYDALQATRAMLQQMPVALVPRSFAITEEMASRVRKPSLLERIFTPRFAPTFAGGSVVAFVLLVFLFATNAGAPVVTLGSSHALLASAPENSAMPDQSRIVSDGTVQPDNFGPSAISTAPTGSESTSGVLGAAPPNSNTVPAPVPQVTDTNTDTVTTALAPPEGTPATKEAPGTTAGGAALDATATAEYAYSPVDTSTEPVMSSYAGDYTTTPPVNLTQVLEAGLLALGVALAAAAVIARRRLL
jgi:hypothetical protein